MTLEELSNIELLNLLGELYQKPATDAVVMDRTDVREEILIRMQPEQHRSREAQWK